jgi:hypothetical protein
MCTSSRFMSFWDTKCYTPNVFLPPDTWPSFKTIGRFLRHPITYQTGTSPLIVVSDLLFLPFTPHGSRCLHDWKHLRCFSVAPVPYAPEGEHRLVNHRSFPIQHLCHSLHRFGRWSHPFGGNEACISLPANRRWISWITIFPLVAKVYFPMRKFLKFVYYTTEAANVKNFLKLF